MLLVGLWMTFLTAHWTESLRQFSQWRWFHPFEVGSRLVLGGLMIVFADSYRSPAFATTLGALILLVGAGLVFTPAASHRRLAAWMADELQPFFRLAGPPAALAGIALAWFALPAW